MKSHFQFTNQQRNGIILLLAIVIIGEFFYLFLNWQSEMPTSIEEVTLQEYRRQIDSLKEIEAQKTKPRLYPFNPNYISDYKGYTLGLSVEAIDRLHQFRAKGKWVNSAEEFQKVTKISDSLIKVISPYFKFPDWVHSKAKTTAKKPNWANSNTTKTYAEKQDLNRATASQLEVVYGVGSVISKRIVAYRSKNHGFIADEELSEVYGLKADVIRAISKHFTVKTPRKIKTYNLNTATRNELVNIPYLDYENLKHIIEERTLRGKFSTFEELTKIEDFPKEKLNVIKLYLYL